LAGTSCIWIIGFTLGWGNLNTSPGFEIKCGAVIVPGSNRVGSPTAGRIGRKDGDGRPEDGEKFLESL